MQKIIIAISILITGCSTPNLVMKKWGKEKGGAVTFTYWPIRFNKSNMDLERQDALKLVDSFCQGPFIVTDEQVSGVFNSTDAGKDKIILNFDCESPGPYEYKIEPRRGVFD